MDQQVDLGQSLDHPQQQLAWLLAFWLQSSCQWLAWLIWLALWFGFLAAAGSLTARDTYAAGKDALGNAAETAGFDALGNAAETVPSTVPSTSD